MNKLTTSLGILFVLFILGTSLSPLLKLGFIYLKPEKVMISSSTVEHLSGLKGGSEFLSFVYVVNGMRYESSSSWWQVSQISRHEVFQVTYSKSNPKLCVPTKYLWSTFFYNLLTTLLSLSFLALLVWSYFPKNESK